MAQQGEKINDLTYELDNVVKLSDLNEIRDRVNCLEKIAEDAKREALRQESYNKRLNLLIHGIEELPDTIWENKLQTQMKLHEVFKKGIDIDLNSIKLVDIHRLPQRPIYNNQHKRITRPIIIELHTALDKDRIMRNLGKLKMYNSETRKTRKRNTRFFNIISCFQPTLETQYIRY